MKRLLKIEFFRAMWNRLTWIALLLGVGLSVVQFVCIVIPKKNTMIDVMSQNPSIPPTSAFAYWIGKTTFTWETPLYFLLIPILAVLPFADSFFLDHKSGYIKNVYIRTKRSNYIVANFITAFIVGGAVVIIPLIINFLLTAAVLPSLLPQVTSQIYGVEMWGALFYQHPHIYLLAYMALDFVFAGLFASMSLAISFFVENRFIVLLFPFLMVIFWDSFCSLLNIQEFNPVNFLVPAQPMIKISFSDIALEALLIAIVALGVYFWKGIHDDTF